MERGWEKKGCDDISWSEGLAFIPFRFGMFRAQDAIEDDLGISKLVGKRRY